MIDISKIKDLCGMIQTKIPSGIKYVKEMNSVVIEKQSEFIPIKVTEDTEKILTGMYVGCLLANGETGSDCSCLTKDCHVGNPDSCNHAIVDYDGVITCEKGCLNCNCCNDG